jgi:hypothetical protein
MAVQVISPAGQRDGGLDSLRGLMLIGMAMNHIASPLHRLTDQPFGYTTSAEGFVFLSGLVAGLVYTRRREHLGPAAAAKASWLRAVTLYRYHIALFILIWSWANFYFAAVGENAIYAQPAMQEQPGWSLLTGLLLVNQPPLLDILPMYAGFMLLLPAVLDALDAGHRGRVLALSLAGWALTNLFWPNAPVDLGILRTGAFNWGAWQLLFLVGVIGGHASVTGQTLLPANRRPWLVAGAVVLCGWCFLIRHWYWWPASIHGFPDWENKNSLAPVRLLNTFALFLLIHLAFVRWPRVFQWRPLALLGRHSLAVFSAHIVLAYLLLAFPEIFAATTFQAWMGTIIMLSTLFAVAVWCEGTRQTAPAVLPRPALDRARVRS